MLDGKIYAVKSIQFNEKKLNEQQSKMQEVEILKELKHTNIIEYIGYFTGPDFRRV